MGEALNRKKIYSYEEFQEMDLTSIHLLEFEKEATQYTPAVIRKLPEHFAIKMRNTIEYIQYLEATGDQTLADDHLNWKVADFKLWLRNSRPTGIANLNPAPPANANATTTANPAPAPVPV